MLIAPNVVVFLLTVLVEIIGGGVEWIPLLFWLATLSGMELFFYSFAVCLGQFTGHILALPVFYGVFNSLALAFYMLVSWVLDCFYYGFCNMGDVSGLVKWLTPAMNLYQCLSFDSVLRYAADQGYDVVVADYYQTGGLGVVGIYALVAVALTVCALLLYRRRHLETAGDVVAVRPMRPVFVYGVAICSGLFFGYLTSVVMNLGSTGLMIAIVVWGVAGYFVARMLLEKSFRVFGKWKGAVAVAAVFAVLFLVVGFDLTGFESRVPEVSQVASVQISGLNAEPNDDGYYLNVNVEDPEIIQKVIDLHQAAVDYGETYDVDVDRYIHGNYGDVNFWNVELGYTLTDGSTMWRSYSSLAGMADEADTPGTVEWAVCQLLSDRDLIWSSYGFDEAEANGTLVNAYCEDWDAGRTEAYFSSEQARQLLEAVRADFYDGNIGVRQVSGDNSKYYVVFQWKTTAIVDENASYAVVGDEDVNRSVAIDVQKTAQRTLALLEDFGVEIDK
jgi:ABC-2 type transport system permease protein